MLSHSPTGNCQTWGVGGLDFILHAVNWPLGLSSQKPPTQWSQKRPMQFGTSKTRLVTAQIRKLAHDLSFTSGFGENCLKTGDLVFPLLPNEAVQPPSVLELQFF